MRVLQVGKFYYPVEGGIESINKVVVDALKGNSQKVISFNTENKTSEEEVDGVPVLRCASYGVVASQPISISYFKELRKLIKEYDPTVIHFHHPNPLAAFYLMLANPKKSKLIIHWHSDVIAQKVLYRFVKPIETGILKRADAIIATSNRYRDYSPCLKDFKEKVTVIPCSIDEQKFDLTAAEEKEVEEIKNKYGSRPIVFFIGRHVEYKGIKYLLEAEKLIKNDCVILIAGQGPLTEELKNSYKSDRIHWIGRLSDRDMKLYYHAADIFAFPSITRNEAFGVVLVESMYCKTPAVTFTIEGSGVNWASPNDETSIEVENSNAGQYAEAVDRLLSDRELRNRLADNGKARAMRLFSRDVVEAQYRDLYRSLTVGH